MAGLANMATSMNPAFRDQRRGPVQARPTGRQNNFNRQPSSNIMPKRNGAANPPINPLPKLPTSNCQDDTNGPNIYYNGRMIAGITHMLGRCIQVEVVNGGIYEGILGTISKEMDLKLEQASLLARDDRTPPSRETYEVMLIDHSDYIRFWASNIDLKGESFTDGGISARSNGQSTEAAELKELVKWDGGLDQVDITLESTGSGSNGWDPDDMFNYNAANFGVKSTYKEDLEGYTTPMPTFKSEEEFKRAEKMASEHARMIESTEGYRQRLDAENNPEVDEETKFSSVIRESSEAESSSTPGRYVPPNRRQPLQDPGQQSQRSAASSVPTSQPPLPQRERRSERAERDRGDRSQDSRESRGWEKNLPVRNQHLPSSSQPGLAQNFPAPPTQHKDVQSERLSGDNRDRRIESSGRVVPPRQLAHPSVPSSSPQRFTPPQQTSSNHSVQPVLHPLSTTISPVSQGQNRGIGIPVASIPPMVPTVSNTSSSLANEKSEPVTLSPQTSSPQSNIASVVTEKKSPRGDRQEKQVAGLKQFHSNFKLSDDDKKEERCLQQEKVVQERRTDHEHGQVSEDVQNLAAAPVGVVPTLQGPAIASQGTVIATQTAAVPTQGSSSISQGVTAVTQRVTASPQAVPATHGPPAQSQGNPTPVAALSVSEQLSHVDRAPASTLNPNAVEFKPRQSVAQVSTPTPSATPPSQAMRQSPGIISHQTTLLSMQNYTPHLVPHNSRMLPLGAGHQPQQQAPKPYHQPKRAVVSVDPAVAHATGQPLTLAAQAATIQQPSYVYQLPPGQVLPQGAQGYPMQMRMVQSHLPQGATMDPSQGASNQQAHMSPYLMPHQQTMPAHMSTLAQAQTLSQAHSVQHQHLAHQGHPNLPPVSQTQSGNPHPSASPVQHMGPTGPTPGGPQLNHGQGAPPTSGTPQPQLPYQMMPPQGTTHAMPAHSVSQGHTQAIHFMSHQHQMQAGVNFTQAGGSGSGGPAPAHLQHSGHMNQPQHVVVMPQPPPQAINQAPLNPPHTHHQHAPTHYQQHMQGAAGQMHGNVGHNQHLLQSSVQSVSAGIAMHHGMHPFVMQTGVQGSPHSSHAHPHSHPHYQGQ